MTYLTVENVVLFTYVHFAAGDRIFQTMHKMKAQHIASEICAHEIQNRIKGDREMMNDILLPYFNEDNFIVQNTIEKRSSDHHFKMHCHLEYYLK